MQTGFINYQKHFIVCFCYRINIFVFIPKICFTILELYDKLLAMEIVDLNLDNSTAQKESMGLPVNTSPHFHFIPFSQEQIKFVKSKETLKAQCKQRVQRISKTITRQIN
jgi:hypothetical protein